MVYATLIIKGKKTFQDVPDRLKEQVKEILYDLVGYSPVATARNVVGMALTVRNTRQFSETNSKKETVTSLSGSTPSMAMCNVYTEA